MRAVGLTHNLRLQPALLGLNAQMYAEWAARLPRPRMEQGHGAQHKHEPASLAGETGSTTVPGLTGVSGGCSPDGRT